MIILPKKCLILFILFVLTLTPKLQSKVLIFDFNTETDKILKIVKPYLPSQPIIFEAGAYNGMDTLHLARHFPKGQIYTFEPIPENFSEVLKNTHKILNIHPFPFALSDTTGTATFYVSQYVSCPDFPCGSSSLLPPKDHLILDTNIIFPKSIPVSTTSIDDFCEQMGIDHIDFMWLDMQGFELNTLNASEIAKRTTLIYSEVIFVEAYAGQYVYSDMKKWLEENDFEIIAADFDEAIVSHCLDHGRYFGNILFAKKRKAS